MNQAHAKKRIIQLARVRRVVSELADARIFGLFVVRPLLVFWTRSFFCFFFIYRLMIFLCGGIAFVNGPWRSQDPDNDAEEGKQILLGQVKRPEKLVWRIERFARPFNCLPHNKNEGRDGWTPCCVSHASACNCWLVVVWCIWTTVCGVYLCFHSLIPGSQGTLVPMICVMPLVHSVPRSPSVVSCCSNLMRNEPVADCERKRSEGI